MINKSKKFIWAIFTIVTSFIICTHTSDAQIFGGSASGELTPKKSKPDDPAAHYTDVEVNLFDGSYNTSHCCPKRF